MKSFKYIVALTALIVGVSVAPTVKAETVRCEGLDAESGLKVTVKIRPERTLGVPRLRLSNTLPLR